LLDAAGVAANTQFPLDGASVLAELANGKPRPRDDLLFFVSETPFKNHINVTAFNDDWKLVQQIEIGLASMTIENYLFYLSQDPYEFDNLAAQYPDVVEELADEIRHWRSLYPVAGTRSEIMPPPGWRAPLDWADYPKALDQLQQEPSGGMPPPETLRALDWQYGESGRLIYNCEPYRLLGGGLCQ